MRRNGTHPEMVMLLHIAPLAQSLVHSGFFFQQKYIREDDIVPNLVAAINIFDIKVI